MFSLNYENKRVVLCSSWIPLPEKNLSPHGDSEFFLFPTLVTRRKTSFFISLPSSKLTISLISIYKHYAIDIANPSSMQDASHMNFEINLAHRGVSVAQW